MSRTRRTEGFTLMELILVIALMGVVSTMGTVVLFKFFDNWRQATIRTRLETRASQIFDQMRQDFAAAVAPCLAGDAPKGITQTAQNAQYHRIPLEDDQVVIPAYEAIAPGGLAQRVDVGYHIDRRNGVPTLMRTVRSADTARAGDATPAAGKTPVAEGVLAMRVEFLAKGAGDAWEPSWSKPEAPEAVRVSVTIADPDWLNQQVARKCVFPIAVD